MFGITEFIAKLSEEQISVFHYLDKELQSKGLSRSIRYKVPFYDYHTWLCYLNPLKNGNFELCFLQGIELVKTNPSLDLKKRKMVAGYEVVVDEDLDIALILQIVQNGMTLQSIKNISS